MPVIHNDILFAPLDDDLHLERIAGGNETEVYRTDDHRYVVKVKSEDHGTIDEAVSEALILREAAQAFAKAVGSQHRIPSYYIVAQNSEGKVQPIIIQPYYRDAKPLFSIDYANLNGKERKRIAKQLIHIIGRSVQSYVKTGRMPDIYGRSSANKSERKQSNAWYMLPWRLWSFVVQRNLMRSHNLMLTTNPKHRIILVDYDPVKHGKLYQFIYYNVRLVLFLRDLALIGIMLKSGFVPKA